MVLSSYDVEHDWWKSTGLWMPKDYNCVLCSRIGQSGERNVEYWDSEFVLRGGRIMPLVHGKARGHCILGFKAASAIAAAYVGNNPIL